jgi:ribose 5-phosphate isomerase B
LNLIIFVKIKITTQEHMKISIGNDHAGPDYKKAIVDFLEKQGHEIINHGTNTTDSVDYPDFGHPVATDVETGKADLGIVICGSGNGIAMTVNKHQGISDARAKRQGLSSLQPSDGSARDHANRPGQRRCRCAQQPFSTPRPGRD